MRDLTSPCDTLDPIEAADDDALRALQLERLGWSLRHADDNVDATRVTLDEAGPHDVVVLRRPGRLDELTVRVEARGDASAEAPSAGRTRRVLDER